jgi:hypothetical protein
MEFIGKEISTGFVVYETFEAYGESVAEVKQKALKAIFPTKDAARTYMRELVESEYDDPLEYNRYMIDGGDIIRREYYDRNACRITEVTTYSIETCGLIL